MNTKIFVIFGIIAAILLVGSVSAVPLSQYAQMRDISSITARNADRAIFFATYGQVSDDSLLPGPLDNISDQDTPSVRPLPASLIAYMDEYTPANYQPSPRPNRSQGSGLPRYSWDDYFGSTTCCYCS